MTRCRSCGVDAPKGSRFCPGCGLPAEPDADLTRTAASTSTPGNSLVGTPSRTHSRFSSSPVDPGSHGRFLPGTLLNERYRIVSLIGKGGMGEVYRADDLALGQAVALKFLPESLLNNENALGRFRNEVRVARQVTHPNVCRVHDVGDVDGHLFLSMEYVDGEDLASLLRRIGRLPEDKALEIARKLCAGLAAAHEKGVLHRDLKPANVMLDARGQVMLTDFGLAGIAEDIAGTEVRSGTPAYMAPEQLAGKEVSARSDIYSLGLVLYELFTGKRPFEAETLSELIKVRSETTPTSLSTIVRDLDPAVERVVMRCLEAEPSRRPPSVLVVSAGLPGGDPLAAALAAGETPSPEMVAAAGEGAGLSARIALPLFAAVLLGIAAHVFWLQEHSPLDQMGESNSPEVLRHKARETLRTLGLNEEPADSEAGFYWDQSLIRQVERNDKPSPRWSEVLPGRPPLLRYWYRQSPYTLTGGNFHDDLLTPGVVLPDDPAPILSGMTHVELDTHGRLLEFRVVPPQREESSKPSSSAFDWTPFFAAAGIDPSQLKTAEPQWAWLEAADTHVAWTGLWPGSNRPLRIEAASWKGTPVVFSLLGPWSRTHRMPPREGSSRFRIRIIALTILAVILLIGATLLARHNFRRGKGDRRGALRLAAFMFAVHMALWLARGHFGTGVGIFAMFILAVCTSVFYGSVVWTLYMAIEPYVRRHWPQALISWSRVLSGRLRDPIVGRDILVGAALSVCWSFAGLIYDVSAGRVGPDFVSTELIFGIRSAAGESLENVPHAVREALIYFFCLFVLRVVLRNQWLAAAAFAGVIVAFHFASGGSVGRALVLAFIFGSICVILLRFGLLALASAILFNGFLGDLPVTFDASAWYFPTFLFMLAGILALTTWAFRESIAGQRWFGQNLLD